MKGNRGVWEGGEKLAALFYADDGLISYHFLARFQESLEIITGLFYMVGLRNNSKKTVGMVYQP